MANKMNRQRPWKRRLRLGFHGASFTTFDRSCGLELWDKIFSAQMGLVPSGAANNLSYCLYGTRQNSVCRHPTHFSTGVHTVTRGWESLRIPLLTLPACGGIRKDSDLRVIHHLQATRAHENRWQFLENRLRLALLREGTPLVELIDKFPHA